MGSHEFSVRWQGNFTFAQGTYSFKALASDGIRVYIDGTLVLDRWLDEPEYQYGFQKALTQGTHLVVVEYYEDTGSSKAQLTWSLN